MVTKEIQFLYRRYTSIANRQGNQVLSFKEWQDHRSKLLGRF